MKKLIASLGQAP